METDLVGWIAIASRIHNWFPYSRALLETENINVDTIVFFK